MTNIVKIDDVSRKYWTARLFETTNGETLIEVVTFNFFDNIGVFMYYSVKDYKKEFSVFPDR